MDYDALLELVKSTRSIRRFKPDSIPDEYIGKIIEVARWAPSGFNQQPWEFVVVRKPELRKKIAGYTGIYWSQSREMEATRESGLSEAEVETSLKHDGYLLMTPRMFDKVLRKVESEILDGSVCLPLAGSELMKQLIDND